MEHVAWTEDPVACLTPEYLSVDPDLGSAREVSAMLDPRPSRSGAAAERARSDDGCDHLIDGTLQPEVA